MQEVKINQLTLDQLIEVSREVHRQPLLSLARTHARTHSSFRMLCSIRRQFRRFNVHGKWQHHAVCVRACSCYLI